MKGTVSDAKRESRVLGYVLVALAASSWGTWPLILRGAARFGYVGPSAEAAVVLLVMTVGSALASLRDRVPGTPPASARWAMAWLGVSDSLNVLLLFAAYAKTRVAVAILTHYLTPIFVALSAPLVLRERLGPRTYAAVGLSFGGLVLLLSPWSSGAGPAANGTTATAATIASADLVGAACGVGSAVFYTSNVLVTKRLGEHYSGSEITAYHGAIATSILGLLALSEPTPDLRALAVVALGSLGPGAAAALLFTWGLRRVPASHASTLTLLEPLVAVVIAASVYDERLAWWGVAGGALILLGAFLVVRPPPPPAARARAAEARATVSEE